MWKDMVRVALAASFWVSAVGMMAVASTSRELLVLAGWAALLALGGNVFLLWHLLVVERYRVETVARLVALERVAEGLRPV